MKLFARHVPDACDEKSCQPVLVDGAAAGRATIDESKVLSALAAAWQFRGEQKTWLAIGSRAEAKGNATAINDSAQRPHCQNCHYCRATFRHAARGVGGRMGEAFGLETSNDGATRRHPRWIGGQGMKTGRIATNIPWREFPWEVRKYLALRVLLASGVLYSQIRAHSAPQ